MTDDDTKGPGGEAGPSLSPIAAAELSLAFDTGDQEGPPAGPEALAALIEAALAPDAALALLMTAEARAVAEASADFLDLVEARSESPPVHLRAVARAALAGQDMASSRRTTPAPANDVEVFQLLAAASDADEASIICRSQSGIWTLEVFTGQSQEDRAGARGVLLLSVHPEHQAGYEGRVARVFIVDAGAERVLAEGAVTEGELYADITLTGLDLRRRDAVNVVFGPAPGGR
jgi:hypothetical protein